MHGMEVGQLAVLTGPVRHTCGYMMQVEDIVEFKENKMSVGNDLLHVFKLIDHPVCQGCNHPASEVALICSYVEGRIITGVTTRFGNGGDHEDGNPGHLLE